MGSIFYSSIEKFSISSKSKKSFKFIKRVLQIRNIVDALGSFYPLSISLNPPFEIPLWYARASSESPFCFLKNEIRFPIILLNSLLFIELF